LVDYGKLLEKVSSGIGGAKGKLEVAEPISKSASLTFVRCPSSQIRHAFLFRPEDPNGLHQVLPPTFAPSSVERIKGNRYPSPGSRLGASVPTRDNEDEIYNTSQLLRDARNLPRNVRTVHFICVVSA
jgi:hypothetical protein